MTPKVHGLAGALSKLHHGLDQRAEKLLQRIESANERSDAAFKAAHAKLDAADAAMADVETFIEGLEKTNGGPSLGDSRESSAPHSGEPQKSWSGQ